MSDLELSNGKPSGVRKGEPKRPWEPEGPIRGYTGVTGYSGETGYGANDAFQNGKHISTSGFFMRIEDEVFRGHDFLPIEVVKKRLDKLRKKHPEYFEPLEKMEKLVYGDRLNKKTLISRKGPGKSWFTRLTDGR